jgi:glycogen operon protein
MRRFVKSDAGLVPAMMHRLSGSPDLYAVSGRQSHHSINFITCHDGFTLADLVSYNEKHNLANGEENRDGANDNNSWNCGVEGPSDDPAIQALRRRQMRNCAALLMVSGGVPMILAGDEMARTQRGNNNAYCQDNEVSWVDWTLVEKNADQVEFFRWLIDFRLNRESFQFIDWGPETEEEHTDVRFHGVQVNRPDLGWESRTLAMELLWGDEHLYVVANAYWDGLEFELPKAGDGKAWKLVMDTMWEKPGEAVEAGPTHLAGPRSVAILEARG